MSSLYPQLFNDWMSEAAKRFGIPLLALTHALLAIGLVLSLASASGRASAATTVTMLTIPTIHVAILVSTETLVRQDRVVGQCLQPMVETPALIPSWKWGAVGELV
jgi:hypothetical protein